MHILLLHQFFVRPNEPGGTRHYELASECIRQGHRVTVITSDVNYQTGKRTGNNRSLYVESDLNGIVLRRVYSYSTLHLHFLRRVFSFLGFTILSVVASFNVKCVDLVVGTSPSLFQAYSAWLVSLLKKAPFLLEIRDLWPEFAIDIGILKNRFLIMLSRSLEIFLYKRVARTIINSPAYKTYLTHKGIDENKITLIANGVLSELFDPENRGEVVRLKYAIKKKFTVVYAGALGIANDIETILQSAVLLKPHREIHFLLVGGGNKRVELEKMAENHCLKNVTFTGSVSKSEIPNYLAAADACVASLKNIPMFRTTYPNKVFDYMAAGRPTVLAIDGVIREVMENANGGVFVEPGNAPALSNAILRLSQNPNECRRMGRSARNYVIKHFDRRRQSEAFVDFLKQMVNHSNSAAACCR